MFLWEIVKFRFLWALNMHCHMPSGCLYSGECIVKFSQEIKDSWHAKTGTVPALGMSSLEWLEQFCNHTMQRHLPLQGRTHTGFILDWWGQHELWTRFLSYWLLRSFELFCHNCLSGKLQALSGTKTTLLAIVNAIQQILCKPRAM